jgi:epoxyqueuosine reductase
VDGPASAPDARSSDEIEAMDLFGKIREEAKLLGFPIAGVAPLASPDPSVYDDGLARGHCADMAWMLRQRDARMRPELFFAKAASVLVLGVPYRHPRPPEPEGLWGAVAAYAWGRDYHNVLGRRLHRLQHRLTSLFPGLESRSFVDAQPVWERWWAERAGLGRCTTSGALLPTGGSPATFLCGLMLSVDVTGPPPEERPSTCEGCGRCVAACPTGAIVAPGRVDARRCLTWLTVENRGAIPEPLRRSVGARLLACDACTEACPHVAAGPAPDAAFAPRNAWLDPVGILQADDEALLRRFEGSALRRPHAVGLKRNAAVVLGNLCEHREAADSVRRALGLAAGHPSAIVREHAAWAARRWGFDDGAPPDDEARDEAASKG